MKTFILTLRFLTRIPFPYKDNSLMADDEFAKGIIFFPIIGAITGIINAIIFLIAYQTENVLFAAACAVLSGVVVTGAFHIDGLADTCDGVFSSRSKEKMLDIMRDSRLGTNGAIAVVFDIVLRISLIYGISTKYSQIILIILTPIAGKMITPILANSVYARHGSGLGNIYIGRLKPYFAVGAVFIGALIIVLALGIEGLLPIFATIITAHIFKKYIEKSIGGMTGDTLGAGAELAEIIFLAASAFIY